MKKIIKAIKEFFKKFAQDWKDGAKIAGQIMVGKKDKDE